MTARRIARVLIDSPLPQLDRLLDYAVPPALEDSVVVGGRVKVPLRTAGRVVEAHVIERATEDAADRPLSDVDAVVTSIPLLPPKLFALARRAADRAAGSASDILRVAVPRRMVRAEKAWLARERPALPVVSSDAVARADAVLAAFPALPTAIDDGERLALSAPAHPVLLPSGEACGAWAELLAAAAVRTLAAGRSAVLVVPDYRDQSQLEAALAALAPAEAVVRLDARQTAPARYAGYLRILADVPCIVVGNRSAVYAPAHEVGLLALWDDGDPLLSEPLSPGVHARDAALVRQELDGCALLFAGHTRTTDVERLVSLGWVRELAPARRTHPRVVLDSTREVEQGAGRIPSSAFAAARAALADGPVLVQVARPGYAPTLVCASCRRPARCLHCSGPLQARRHGAVPTCGWCARQAHAWKCAHCSSEQVRMASSGSERTADELGRAFPGVRIVVSDGEHPMERVDDAPALVIATRGAEPLCAGGYRAVLLLDGDRMLQAEDLRIGESCLRWWSNAAALAAPGAPVHLAGVDGPVARSLATWTQPAYARAELADRVPLRMPPAVRVAAVTGERARVDEALAGLRERVPALADDAVLGPVPIDDGAVRALVRFDYASGRAVAEHLRAAVVADAVRARRPAKGKPPQPRNTLKVRVDVPDLEL